MEPLAVANDLDGDHLARLVVPALKNLAKRPFAEDVDDLVAEAQMVVIYDQVVTSVIVVPVVVRRAVPCCGFLGTFGPDVVDFRVIEYLAPLVVGQVVTIVSQCLCEARIGQRTIVTDQQRSHVP